MKKFITLLLLLTLAASCCHAESAPEADVFVSISDDTGALVLAYAPIHATDADGDGALTLNDALLCAHAACHPQGTDAYLAEPSEFGMSMYRLWGVDNGGSYGYCVNDVSAMSPLDPIQAGDHVKAYPFTDLSAWSDAYSCFQAPTLTVRAGEAVPMTLLYSGFDANWTPVVQPAVGAALTVDGEMTEALTDAEGIALLTFGEAGVYVVSAKSESQVLVPPVCIVTVE